MRIVSGILFWTGILLAMFVAGLTMSDNVVAEVIVGLMFTVERVFLAFTALASFVLIVLGIVLKRHKRLPIARWRLVTAGIVLLGGVALSVVALKPGFKTRTASYDSEGVTLAATLYSPTTSDPTPALVLVHGSAAFKRSFYDAFARRLVRKGYAVLLADKRGAGDSGGEFQSDNNGSIENLTLLSKDVVAGVKYLTNDPAIDQGRIGLFGISQAGWVAPLAATSSPTVSYMVLLTAPTVSIGEEGAWSDLRGDDQGDAIVGFVEAEQRILETGPSGFDPRSLLGQLQIPALWLFGDIDNSIPSRKSIAVLDSLSAKHYQYKLYSGYGHMLIGKGTSRVPNLAPESWSDIFQWLAVDAIEEDERLP